MSLLVNSYGKTWHLSHTGRHDGQPGHPLPMGEAMLMWSFNRDGEADESLRQSFIAALGVDEDMKRRDRLGFVDLAHPQHGVNRLRGAFPNAVAQPPRVRDVADSGEKQPGS